MCNYDDILCWDNYSSDNKVFKPEFATMGKSG